MRLVRLAILRACVIPVAVACVVDVVQGQVTDLDSALQPAPAGNRRGPLMLELSAGRTKQPGITSGGGPGTIAAGIGAGRWVTDRVMLGVEARAHGTIDIEASVPSVRFVSGVVAVRSFSGEVALRLAAGPAWVVNPNRRAARTIGYAASIELPLEPDLREASWVVFLRYSGTGIVSTPAVRSAPFRTTQLALGIRLEL